MKHVGWIIFIAAVIVTMIIALSTPAEAADWRWAKPKLKEQTVTYKCATMECIRKSYVQAKKRYKKRLEAHDKRRLQEWKKWTKIYIPHCTWYGESGVGPEYSPSRYTMSNTSGSGAYGKFQFMPKTYHNRAKYHDWSALDQEIAARREYWANGTAPWTNCH